MKKNKVLGLLFLTVLELHGQTLELEKQVMVSGDKVSGGQFELSSSMGQVFTTQSTGNNYVLQAGFWQQDNDLIFTDEFE
ncbi:MAG: hypothetical protein R3E90_01000 [Marinicella sp.]|nr:hypothetical protein [Xanthomonadales bacterium]